VDTILAGTVISWVRRVAHRALACQAAPAALSTLNAIQARVNQAAFAVNFPEGACANDPSFSSAMTCSMVA